MDTGRGLLAADLGEQLPLHDGVVCGQPGSLHPHDSQWHSAPRSGAPQFRQLRIRPSDGNAAASASRRASTTVRRGPADRSDRRAVRRWERSASRAAWARSIRSPSSTPSTPSTTSMPRSAAYARCRSVGSGLTGAKSYAKGIHVEPLWVGATGHRYSPVRLMCSHPSGETWVRNSAGVSSSAFCLAKTASLSFSVFQ